MGIEPTFLAWQANILAVILCLLKPHVGIEPTSLDWKSKVLADKRMGQIKDFSFISFVIILYQKFLNISNYF